MPRHHWARILGISRQAAFAGFALLGAFVLTVAATNAAQGQVLSVVHAFAGGQDGANPYSGVTIDTAGNLYGTTASGGAGYGIVYKLVQSDSGWTLHLLYSFTGGSDGGAPRARVVIGPDGSLYGATFQGGGNGCHGRGCGTVFQLQPPARQPKTALDPWTETVLYRFTGDADGGQPKGDLVFDSVGNIYGTTEIGGLPHSCSGLGCGTVFELTRSGNSWKALVLHQFSGGPDGSFPNSGLTSDESGDFYGTTVAGGANNLGSVFQLTPAGSGWKEKVIYSFKDLTDGVQPSAGAILDNSGKLYGATVFGGTDQGGTVYELKRSGPGWKYSVLYNLAGNAGPLANLALDAAGDIYGTTYQDGVFVLGSAFKLTRSAGSWGYTSLHDFTGGDDGQFPLSNLAFDANGNAYGTAVIGGAYGQGVVWQINVPRHK